MNNNDDYWKKQLEKINANVDREKKLSADPDYDRIDMLAQTKMNNLINMTQDERNEYHAHHNQYVKDKKEAEALLQQQKDIRHLMNTRELSPDQQWDLYHSKVIPPEDKKDG